MAGNFTFCWVSTTIRCYLMNWVSRAHDYCEFLSAILYPVDAFRFFWGANYLWHLYYSASLKKHHFLSSMQMSASLKNTFHRIKSSKKNHEWLLVQNKEFSRILKSTKSVRYACSSSQCCKVQACMKKPMKRDSPGLYYPKIIQTGPSDELTTWMCITQMTRRKT